MGGTGSPSCLWGDGGSVATLDHTQVSIGIPAGSAVDRECQVVTSVRVPGTLPALKLPLIAFQIQGRRAGC